MSKTTASLRYGSVHKSLRKLSDRQLVALKRKRFAVIQQLRRDEQLQWSTVVAAELELQRRRAK